MNGSGHFSALLTALAILCAGLIARPVAAGAPAAHAAEITRAADPLSVPAFDASVKDKTDRFVYKFGKPQAGGGEL